MRHGGCGMRSSPSIDWIVVCAHQAAVSTAERANGADLGIRREWVPLFDRYGVDLVVCGHEHHYERTHPVRGQQPNDTLTPVPRSSDISVADTSLGTVHMVIGSGGTSVPTSQHLTSPPRCRVITGAGPADVATGKRPPVYVWEDAPWSAFRDSAHSYGFAAFTVDPGTGPGAATSIDVTYYTTEPLTGALSACDSFTLTRRRSDGPGTGPCRAPSPRGQAPQRRHDEPEVISSAPHRPGQGLAQTAGWPCMCLRPKNQARSWFSIWPVT